MARWLFLTLFLAGPQALGAPLVEDATQRRAIRGAPVETVRESEALRTLSEFEEASFPRPLPGGLPGTAEPLDPPGPPAVGAHGLGPDALPPELSSPQAAASPSEPRTAIPWLEQLKLPDLPVRFDARVLRYLEFYKTDRRGRAIMSSWLKAQGRYRPLITEALRQAGLPQALLYVSMIESGYDPHDRSHAGAVGLWQFMPEGGRIYGLRIDYWVDERKDPERATQAAMRYLGDLKERFGSWPLALAAFNAGYGALLRAMQKYNTNDYWELCRHEDGLPWETTLYVPKWLAAAVVGENRELFGYADVPADPPLLFDRVHVSGSTSLAAIARAAGVPSQELEALNPELRRKRTPPSTDGRGWEVRVPRGAAQRFYAAIGQERDRVRPYVLRFGERLDEVARAHGLSTRALRQLNGVEDSTEVRPGLTLVVPEDTTPATPSPCDTVIVAVPDKDATVTGRKRVFYRTLPQDTVRDVAAFFGVRITDLQRWNQLDPDAKLAGNMVLQIWVPEAFDASRVALVDPSLVRLVTVGSEEFFDLVETKRGRVRLVYTVKKGDDLKKIGRRFGLTVADLERINRFGAKHHDLAVGEKLTVYRAMSAAEKQKAACRLVPGGADRAVQAAGPADDPQGDAEASAGAGAEQATAHAVDEADLPVRNEPDEVTAQEVPTPAEPSASRDAQLPRIPPSGGGTASDPSPTSTLVAPDER